MQCFFFILCAETLNKLYCWAALYKIHTSQERKQFLYVFVEPQFALKWAAHNFSQSQTVFNCCLRPSSNKPIYTHIGIVCTRNGAAQSRNQGGYVASAMHCVVCTTFMSVLSVYVQFARVCIIWVVRWYKELRVLWSPTSHTFGIAVDFGCVHVWMCIVASESNSRAYTSNFQYTHLWYFATSLHCIYIIICIYTNGKPKGISIYNALPKHMCILYLYGDMWNCAAYSFVINRSYCLWKGLLTMYY